MITGCGLRPQNYLNYRAFFGFFESQSRAAKATPRALLAVGAVVQAFAQFLAGPEKRHALFADGHRRPGSRIASLTRWAHLDGECAEATELHSVATRQSRCDFVEHSRNDALHIAVIEMRVALRQPRH